MSKFEGTDFDNVEQGLNIGEIKGAFNSWKKRWNKGTEWGIVGGKVGEAKPDTVLDTVLNHGDATYARDQARSTEGLGALLESLTEIFDGDVIETEHRNKLEEDIEDLLSVLQNPKWNPRNIPFTTVIDFTETDDDPIVERGQVFGHYRTEAYNEYVTYMKENKQGFKGQFAQTNSDWYNEKKGKAKPPLWQAITGEGETEYGKNGLLAIARKALKGVDKIKMGDGNRIAVFNNSAGPRQLAQIKSVQEKVMEVLNNRNIYPAGKSRAPMKDRLNAAFTNESYAIRNAEEAQLLNFAKGYDRVEGIEKIKNIQLRFPRNNIALNKTIKEVLNVLGQEITEFETPKAKEGTAKPGLVLKQQGELQIENTNWQNILKNDEIEKAMGVKFQDRSAKKFFIDTDKQYGQKTGARKYKSYFAGQVLNQYNKDRIPVTLQFLQELKEKIDEGRRVASQSSSGGRVAPDAGRFITGGY